MWRGFESQEGGEDLHNGDDWRQDLKETTLDCRASRKTDRIMYYALYCGPQTRVQGRSATRCPIACNLTLHAVHVYNSNSYDL